MARTRSKPKGGSRNSKSKGPKVNFTRSTGERSTGGNQIFLRLNDDEKFVGYALFDPDPAADDNDGYVEYGEHWDQKANRFVPCWGIKNGCIYCRGGAQASQRALGAFLVTSINGEELEEPEIRLFRLNWTMIQEWGDTLEEDGSTLGQKIRIKCQSRQDGDYVTKFFDKEKLTKKDLNAALKDLPEIEDLLQKNLDRALEALAVENVLEDVDDDDDDDDDDEDTPKSSKSKSKTSKSNKKKKDEDEDDDDDEEEEEEEDDDEESDDDEDSDDDDSEEDDDDEEESDDDDSEDDEDEESDDDEDEDSEESLEGEFTVVSASESEMTFTLKELDNDVYVGADIAEDVDFDDFKKGDKIRLVAAQDDDEDWVATEIEKIQKKSGGSKSKKGGKKKK